VELFRQGEALTEVFLIKTGLVKLVSTAQKGHESILSLAFPGEWLGTAAVIANAPTPAAAVTCASALIAATSAESFLAALQSDRELSAQIHLRQATELCRQSHWIGQLGSANGRQRLELMLRRLIPADPSPKARSSAVKLQLPLHHWELARLVAISPEHLSRLLADMQAEGIIVREKGAIVVRDVRRLSSDELV
jgi:CRP/FNR family transcriptional regulator